MNKASKSLSSLTLVGLTIILGACASSGSSYSSKTSPQINYAPAIDVSYHQVSENITEHIGTNVRWGGQIVGSEDIANKTRLTVFAYPLARDGKPITKPSKDYSGGRFVVDIENQDIQGAKLQDRFVTVYGRVSGEQKIVNGPLATTLPVLAAEEIEDWVYVSRRQYADLHLGLAYHGLGFRYGHGYGNRYGFYGSPYYGYHYSYYPSRTRLGHHRRHHRRH